MISKPCSSYSGFAVAWGIESCHKRCSLLRLLPTSLIIVAFLLPLSFQILPGEGRCAPSRVRFIPHCAGAALFLRLSGESGSMPKSELDTSTLCSRSWLPMEGAGERFPHFILLRRSRFLTHCALNRLAHITSLSSSAKVPEGAPRIIDLWRRQVGWLSTSRDPESLKLGNRFRFPLQGFLIQFRPDPRTKEAEPAQIVPGLCPSSFYRNPKVPQSSRHHWASRGPSGRRRCRCRGAACGGRRAHGLAKDHS